MNTTDQSYYRRIAAAQVGALYAESPAQSENATGDFSRPSPVPIQTGNRNAITALWVWYSRVGWSALDRLSTHHHAYRP